MLKQKRLFLSIALVLLAFLFTSTGCSKNGNLGVTYNSGIEIYPEMLKKVTLGLSEKEIISLLGSPSFIGITNPSIWFYSYQKTWYFAVFKEKLIDQQILILTFDKNSFLTDIQRKNIKNTRNILLNKQETKLYYKKSYIKPDLY